MRFLHTSDWHLGRIFCGVHLTGEQEWALERLTDIIRDAGVGAVVVAGDIFDRAVPPVDAVNLLDDALHRIVYGLKIPVIAIAGNHDSPERLAWGNRLLTRQGLHVFGRAAAEPDLVVLGDAYGEVAFCPVPYADAPFVRVALGDDEIDGHGPATAALIKRAESAAAGYRRRVAVAHTFVAGGETGGSERPLSVGGAQNVPATLFSGFHYTALGHLHRPQRLGTGMAYSGSLLKYSFDEAEHNKAVFVVEMDGEGAVQIEPVELSPRKNVRCIRGTLEELISRAHGDPARLDFIKATLTDGGAIFDAMGRLRTAYPNALEIEREMAGAGPDVRGVTGDYRRFTDFDLFCDFYHQATGRPLAEESLPALRAALDEARRAGDAQ